jgi:Flp pilus assembly protein TadG
MQPKGQASVRGDRMKTRRYTGSDWRKKGISRGGTAIVEFAMIVGLFLMLIFGIIEFGRMMLMYHHVGNAAREGSRYAIVHGSTSLSNATFDDVQNHVRSISPLDPNNVIVTTTWEAPIHAPGTWVRVQVSYNFNSVIPIWFGSGIPLTSASRMVISY